MNESEKIIAFTTYKYKRTNLYMHLKCLTFIKALINRLQNKFITFLT